MAVRAQSGIPWPGPKAYTEWDAPFFLGRQREVQQILDRKIATGALTVLMGESGAGKSSLLAAGLAPTLWERWIRANTGLGSGPRAPLPVILRAWGEGQSNDFDELFHQLLQAGLWNAAEFIGSQEGTEGLATRVRRVIPRIHRSAPHPISLVSLLCEELGPIILLLDQFEEVLLRPGVRLLERPVQFVADVLRFESRAQVLLSLRKELIASLAPLESLVGGVLDRLEEIYPLSVETAVSSALQAAQSAESPRVTIEPKVIGKLRTWARVSSGDVERAAGRRKEGTGPQVDLLVFQCILRDAYDRVRTDHPTSDRVVITEDDLPSFRSKIKDADRQREILKRWIVKAISTPTWNRPRLGGEGQSSYPFELLDHRVIDPLVSRTTRLIAPHLSAGDFKVSQSEEDLRKKALGDDMDRLERPSSQHMTSGPARGLSHDTAKRLLKDVFRETLERLEWANVLKRYRVDGRCELVHDKLAKPLTIWADLAKQDNWNEAVASLVASAGLDITVSRPEDRCLGEEVPGVVWRGAWITPRRSADGVFAGTKFLACDLSGAIFSRCTFRGVTFEGDRDGGKLDGLMFIDCRFEKGPHGPNVFRRVASHGLTFQGTAPGLSRAGYIRFEDSSIRQLLFRKTMLTGPIVVGGGELPAGVSSAIFEDLTKGGNGRLHLEPGSQLSYSSWDSRSKRALFGTHDPPADRTRFCGPLVPALRTR